MPLGLLVGELRLVRRERLDRMRAGVDRWRTAQLAPNAEHRDASASRYTMVVDTAVVALQHPLQLGGDVVAVDIFERCVAIVRPRCYRRGMRRILMLVIAVAAAGCGSEPTEEELHERVPCSDRWSAVIHPFTPGETTCDAPCADQLRVQRDSIGECYVDAVSGKFVPGRVPGEIQCNSTYDTEWEGARGCCIPDHQDAPVTFVTCKD